MISSKQNEVVDSIKKLITLGVTDSEIIENLKEVGIKEIDAKELIKLARSNENNKSEKKVDVDDSDGLSFNDQIVSQAKIISDDADSSKEKVEDSSPTAEEIDFEDDEKSKNNDDSKKNMNSNNTELEERLGKLINKKNYSDDEKVNLNENKNKIKVDDVKNNIDEDDEKVVEEKNSSQKTSLDFKQELEKELRELEKSRGIDNSRESTTVEKKLNVSTNNFSNNFEKKQVLDYDLEQMWKKGIVVAINSKLNEMKKLKEDIDYLVEDKVNDAVKKETKQFKVLLESQKDLIVSSNKEVLEQKQKEISFIIDSKISEIKKQAKDLSEYVEIMQKSKDEQQKILSDIKTTLDDAKKTKSQLIIEMNSELIKSKSKAQEFIDKSSDQIKEMDERINKTLELEKNIAEGLVEEAEQKIERMTLSKAESLIDELEVKLNNLSAMEKNINVEEIQTKISLLDQFKKEFLRSMEENIKRLNDAIEQINIKNSDVQKELDEKTLAIDAKLEELTNFEKTFTSKLEKILALEDTKKKAKK